MRKSERILRRPEVIARTGLSTSSIYAGIQEGSFPTPVPLGPNSVGWLEGEIDKYIEGRIEARAKRLAKKKSAGLTKEAAQ